MYQLPPERLFHRGECITFRKTHEDFGAFSNMADGFPLCVNEGTIRYAEALYQACRFPDAPEIQHAILAQASPMAAKFIAKKHTLRTRLDWELHKVEIMRWVVQLKCLQHRERLLPLFLETGDLPIVEESRRDHCWGATPYPDGETLVGHNILGLLLMEARALMLSSLQTEQLPQPLFPDARLLGQPMRACFTQTISEAPLTKVTQLALSF